jgi:hypothetical protein
VTLRSSFIFCHVSLEGRELLHEWAVLLVMLPALSELLARRHCVHPLLLFLEMGTRGLLALERVSRCTLLDEPEV